MPAYHLRIYTRCSAAPAMAEADDGLNLVQANGPGAQQSVAHFHIHVLPRKQGDDLKLNWGAKPRDPNTIAAIAEKIRAKLSTPLHPIS